MAGLPEELIEDILLRLPAKSLLRFKTASKKCYSLISEDKEFTKGHLKQSSSSKNIRLFFIQLDYESAAIFQYSEEDENASKTDQQGAADKIITRAKINFPTEIQSGRVVGSANGLICVDRSSAGPNAAGCFLWNPSTGECKKIYFPVNLPGWFPTGFCYDSYSDDYKIVGSGSRLHINSPTGIPIFSLKENSWTVHEYHDLYHATFFNGAFHWCLKRKILVFDLAKEEFFHIELPKQTRPRGFYAVKLFVWLGSLCLPDNGSLWVMKEYGVAKSWAKLTTDHVELPVGFPIEKVKDSIPHQESLISPKYFIKDQS